MLVAPQHRAGAPRYGRLGLSRARPASPDRVVGITNVPSAGIGPEVEIAELRLIHPVEAIRVSNDAGEIQGESPCLQIYEFRRRERSLIHRRAERALTWGHICSRERPIPASRIIGCLVESPESALEYQIGPLFKHERLSGGFQRSDGGISCAFGGVGARLGGFDEFARILPAALHLAQLAAQRMPLQEAYDHPTEGGERNGRSQADHPALGPLHAVFNVLYLASHALVG